MPTVEDAVRYVLKTKARAGSTTKSTASTLVWQRIKDTGGPTRYGIGTAAMIIGCKHVIDLEVTRQFKTNLSEHEIEFILPTTIPADLIKIMGRVPRWIAIEEGPDAMWMYWRAATPRHWKANADMKRKKAEQTLVAARYSQEIADYLETHGISKLGDVFRDK